MMQPRSSMFNMMGIFSVLLLAGAGCTKSETTPSTSAPATQETAAAPAAPAGNTAAAPAAKVDPNKKPDVELTLGSDGDNIAFDKTELKVKAGQTVRVTFKNNVKTSGMSHNWVLVKPGTEADVANEGTAAGEASNWIQESDKVLAHTKLVKQGESDSVTFVAPAAGSYPYICTFPGHSMLMKGTLVSQ